MRPRAIPRHHPGKLLFDVALVSAIFIGPSTRADSVLWYNGDYDKNSSLTNAKASATNFAYVYDDFVVPAGQTWTIDRVWSDDLMTVNATRAFWAIRKGLAPGNAGTLVAGGDVARATLTPTGLKDPATGYPDEMVQVSNLNVVLTAGTYYLAVARHKRHQWIVPQHHLRRQRGGHAAGQRRQLLRLEPEYRVQLELPSDQQHECPGHEP